MFGGSNEGNLFALDAGSGAPLWSFQTGGAIRTNPISYAVDGRQYVAIAGGDGALHLRPAVEFWGTRRSWRLPWTTVLRECVIARRP